MTTRYVNDLFGTTEAGYYGFPEYVSDLQIVAAHAGRDVLHTRIAVASEKFDALLDDVQERFLITVGIFKAAAAIADVLPEGSIKGAIRALLAMAIKDFEGLDEESGEAHDDAPDADTPEMIIRRLRVRFSAGQARCAGVLAIIETAPECVAVLSLGMGHYTMLIEQCDAWLAEIEHARAHGVADVGAIRFGSECANRDAFHPAATRSKISLAA